jgi:hypothetical protein
MSASWYWICGTIPAYVPISNPIMNVVRHAMAAVNLFRGTPHLRAIG